MFALGRKKGSRAGEGITKGGKETFGKDGYFIILIVVKA